VLVTVGHDQCGVTHDGDQHPKAVAPEEAIRVRREDVLVRLAPEQVHVPQGADSKLDNRPEPPVQVEHTSVEVTAQSAGPASLRDGAARTGKPGHVRTVPGAPPAVRNGRVPGRLGVPRSHPPGRPRPPPWLLRRTGRYDTVPDRRDHVALRHLDVGSQRVYGTLAGVQELPFRPEPVEVLLFDLGGVVVDIDFRRCFAHWAHSADCDVEELASRFSIDAAYEAHERGRLPISEYLEHLRRTLGLALTDDELLAGWNDIWTGVNADIGPLLTLASNAFPLYAFTNSNPTHRAVWSQRFAEALGIFTSTFVSSEIGHRKPERAAFDYVASMIGAPPESILFLDDGPENVTGAREAGMQAVHVTSTDSVRNALARLGATEHGTPV
jgi:glucose-1-phosphatase